MRTFLIKQFFCGSNLKILGMGIPLAFDDEPGILDEPTTGHYVESLVMLEKSPGESPGRYVASLVML